MIRYITICVFSFLSLQLHAQNYRFKGLVKDSLTHNAISGVTVRVDSFNTKTDTSGKFAILLSKRLAEINFSHPEYASLRQTVVSGSTEALIYLIRKNNLMNEVTIRSGSSNSRNSAEIQTLSKADIEKTPSFLGQRDPLKTIGTLPGTGNSGEGNSGLYIRGANSGQNLTLFNNATIYNPSHLLGFFSVFNNSAVETLNLYKSGIPSEFGGRLSSIIDISGSKQVQDSAKSQINISPLSLDGSIDVPITKHWSVSSSIRKTFMNYTVWPAMTALGFKSSAFEKLKYDFYDLNLSSNARLGKRNTMSFSVYNGGDDFGFSQSRFSIRNGMNWENTASSISLKSSITEKLLLNSSANYSRYKFNFNINQDKFQANIHSKIRDINLKSAATLYLGDYKIKAGIEFTDHIIRPNTPSAQADTLIYDFGQANVYHVDESAAFLSNEFKVSPDLGIYTGLRATYYRHRGPYTYLDENKQSQTIGNNVTASSLFFLEPSVTLKYQLNAGTFLKASYSRNTQTLHLISVTAVNFPADFWMPSIKGLNPEKGHQASLGYHSSAGSYEAYSELYYRSMTGLVEFSGGIMNMLDNLKIEENLYHGKGNAYGSEFFLKKKNGRLTGWLGYTLSKSNRNFASINEGNSFPAKYDRRHDMNAVLNYQLFKKLNLSGLYTYATGNSYTKPVSRYFIAGNVVNEYGDFNGDRMPDYHRMDLSATYQFTRRRHSSAELSLSVYNVYNRQNPMYLYFMAEGDLNAQRVSVKPKSVAIMPILPSINYSIKFY